MFHLACRNHAICERTKRQQGASQLLCSVPAGGGGGGAGL